MKLSHTFFALILTSTLIAGHTLADDGTVSITSNFPGGNIRVVRNEGPTVELAPDLRGGRDWFYWCFEAVAAKPGKVVFSFPEKIAGSKNGAVGGHGPAISSDGGKTWRWMGMATAVTPGRSFSHEFAKAGETVRFAVTIPYLHSDFKAFAERNAGNAHLRISVLTKSLKGRDVELVRIGKPSPDVKAVLMTCRHHACETMASFLLEGLMQTAISDTPAGEAFRRKYVLYVVPFVDKDGVEDGDQGKWRAPHDHNRDYGDKPRYPEVKAIMELAESADIRALLDFHCPTLAMPDHQVMYFAGPMDVPPHNHETVKQLAAGIKAEMPKGAPFGPLVWLKKADAERPSHCSGFFGLRKGILMAATLEFPYAPPKAIMDPDSVRTYGAAVLRAWNKMEFVK